MSRQPNWTQLASKARLAERQAQVFRSAAEQSRCKEADSAGAQCTADYFPPTHEHRYEDEDVL